MKQGNRMQRMKQTEIHFENFELLWAQSYDAYSQL